MTVEEKTSFEQPVDQGFAPYRPVRSAVMGIVAPVLCIIIQFSLFTDLMYELPGLRFLNTFPLFNYGIVTLEALALAIWLSMGERVGRWAGLVSGMLLAGSLFAGVLGLVLLPFSLAGLLVGIGILGLIPLFTAHVFLRNGIRAYRLARSGTDTPRVWASVVLGGAIVIAFPGAAQARLSWAVQAAVTGVIRGDPAATARLRGWPSFVYRDRLVWAYQGEADAVRRQRIAGAFKELYGEDIGFRLRRLND